MRALPSVAGSLAISVAAVGVLATDGGTAGQVAADATLPAAAHVASAPPTARESGKPGPESVRTAEGPDAPGTPAPRRDTAEPPASRSGSRGPVPVAKSRHDRKPGSTKQREHRRKEHAHRPPLTTAEIARATGAPESAVARQWPVLEQALADQGMTGLRTRIAAFATIVTEVGDHLRPINEYGGPGYFTQMYEGRSDLGNYRAGDGARYHGRGYIQLTGRANYRTYGAKLGLPLEERPELALRPEVAAKVLALYFKDRAVDDAAQQGRWGDVRLRVNGGYNGWSRYWQVVTALLRAASR